MITFASLGLSSSPSFTAPTTTTATSGSFHFVLPGPGSLTFLDISQFNSGGGGQTNTVMITQNGSTLTFIDGVQQVSMLPPG